MFIHCLSSETTKAVYSSMPAMVLFMKLRVKVFIALFSVFSSNCILLKHLGLQTEIIATSRSFTLMRMAYIWLVNVRKVLLSYHHLSHQNQTTNPLPQGQQYHLYEQHWAVNPDAMNARYPSEPSLLLSLQDPMSACHELLFLAAAPTDHDSEVQVQTHPQTTCSHMGVPVQKDTTLADTPSRTHHTIQVILFKMQKRDMLDDTCAYNAQNPTDTMQMPAGNLDMQDSKGYLLHNVGPSHQFGHRDNDIPGASARHDTVGLHLLHHIQGSIKIADTAVHFDLGIVGPLIGNQALNLQLTPLQEAFIHLSHSKP